MISENYYDGLIAEWYDDWLQERKDDIEYYTMAFAGFRGEVLELACGTGRILIPIAKQGVAIDGLDSSADMLAKLSGKIQRNNLKSVNVYHQSMTKFELPHKYDAIFVSSGSFQLLTSEKDSLSCLKSIQKHLTPQGFLLLDVFIPWENIRTNTSETFAITRDNTRGDGSRCLVMEKFQIDIVRQVINSVFKYEVYKNGYLQSTLTNDFPLRWYWEDEMEILLKKAGFVRVELLRDSPLYQKGSHFVFRAS